MEYVAAMGLLQLWLRSTALTVCIFLVLWVKMQTVSQSSPIFVETTKDFQGSPDAVWLITLLLTCVREATSTFYPTAVTCPYNINFRSDEYEVTAGTALESEAKAGTAANRGFQLIYFMDGNNCNPSATANTIGWVITQETQKNARQSRKTYIVFNIYCAPIYFKVSLSCLIAPVLLACENILQLKETLLFCKAVACKFTPGVFLFKQTILLGYPQNKLLSSIG